ncbi:MAG: 16S rRNA (guanine(966)-N(2))-methyltransferase RsmD [Microthrixaceae bacterium]|nr:16S rRNA (guanine(966)-N(2))-methyltransferase RsmD [Microthrixaceae bacterium]MCB1010533.1 16S rRNA (guanine(966)-N(2))-methyltransferase RsmD [Microthrixaceae bacterium]MCB9386370.1 16S rRNA (guanine(966)-N(2))-methyltransferase RsmD [Microthrixaceae bacterium]MCO5320907.1 16S rRNA (guanine(966)-N(2))-methyltransferase RsmD [Microthrixaceae bacterium]
MRVVAGSARGLALRAPDDSTVRPTTDRVRESLFNSLNSQAKVTGAAFVDLFAGTGALGIEALSRGASECVFVESDPAAVELVRDNLGRTHLEASAEVMRGDALDMISPGGTLQGRRFDVALADPPYSFDRWDELLSALDASTVVIESDREIGAPPPWRVLRCRAYGTTVVTILERAEAPDHPEIES